MGWLSWLFGKKEEKGEPEILVLGAELKCPYGSRNSFLYVQTEDIDLNHLPEACVSDSEALLNILPFGSCYLGTSCDILMKMEENWQNPTPQTKMINGKEVITTESLLICKGSGMSIEAVTSGQEGVFAKQLILMREMDAKYPGLRELLEDPYGSLYLKDGMYQLAIQFLQDRMVPPREDIFIFGLDTKNSLEDAYIMAVFERLLPHCNTTEPGMFLGGLETVIMDHGLNNGADAHYLNAAMIAVLRKECGDYAKLVKQGGYYKWQEENKLFLNWLADATNTLAYAALAYSAMKNYENRSNDRVAVKEEQAKNSAGGKGEVGNEGAGKVPEGLTRAQNRNVETLNNVIENNLKEHDFSGTLRDLQGNPVPKPNGGFWDHKTEMIQSYDALQGVKNGLEGSLKNPNLTPEINTYLQQQLGTTNSYIEQIENLFAPFGGIK